MHVCNVKVCMVCRRMNILYINSIITYRGDSLIVQADKVSASACMDRKVVMVMSTNCQPSDSSTVQRKQKDGNSVEVPCPASIISYNRFMGGVDRGDQLRGYYRCRSRSRKFYKYIFYFLLDVAITNAYILMKSSGQSFKDFKSFRLQLAKDLIWEYCSRHGRGHVGTVIHPLPFRHYPIRLDSNDKPRRPRGPCALHQKSTIDVSILPGTVVNVGSGYAIAETHQVTAS